MLSQPHHNHHPLRKCALAIAALLFATVAHAQTVASIPVSALPIHYHDHASTNESGWFALPLPATVLPGSTSYAVRLELDAWVNTSTQTNSPAASEVAAQSSLIQAMLTLNGVQQWGTAHVMMEVARNQDFTGTGHVGVEQLVRESTSWTWVVPASVIGNRPATFGVECEFASSLSAAFGVTNSDGSGAIEGAQLFVTPVVPPLAPVAAYACQGGSSLCFSKR